MTTLAEDLVILAVGLKPKTGPDTGKLPMRFKFGLRGAEVSQWMTDLPSRYAESYFERLRVAGAISPVRVWLLLIAKRTGYLLVDQAYFHQVRMRLHTAVTSSGPVDAAHAALAGLAYAAGLAQLAYPGGGANAVLRARLEQLAGGTRPWPAPRRPPRAPAKRRSPTTRTGGSTIRRRAPGSRECPGWLGSRRPCGPPARPRCTR